MHHIVDLEADFAAVVVEPFVAGYLAGETPNPCVVCNRLRLAALVRFAGERGVTEVATGHYARLVREDGEVFVARGDDRRKDQSYMLWDVAPEVLEHLVFPLAASSKPESRAAAARAGLEVADEPESQEVCFATAGYQPFLEARGVEPCPGAIVDRAGTRLGRHEGQWRYTIGQRRGLGLTAPRPLYVIARRADVNEVVVGEEEALLTREVVVRELRDRGLGDGSGLEVQLRYRSRAVPVAGLRRLADGGAVVTLATPFAGVAPGQSAVFYRDDVVRGGGIIDGAAAPDGGDA